LYRIFVIVAAPNRQRRSRPKTTRPRPPCGRRRNNDRTKVDEKSAPGRPSAAAVGATAFTCDGGTDVRRTTTTVGSLNLRRPQALAPAICSPHAGARDRQTRTIDRTHRRTTGTPKMQQVFNWRPIWTAPCRSGFQARPATVRRA
jgi:hypothetical protein